MVEGIVGSIGGGEEARGIAVGRLVEVVVVFELVLGN